MNKGRIYLLFLVIVLLFVIGHRFLYAGNYAATWDQVDFALSLNRFDLSMMQPHFPGYPFFVLGGMLFESWIKDPILSFAFFNKLMLGLSAIPMYGIARRYLSRSNSLLAVITWQVIPYWNVLSSIAMSDIAAVSILWWYFWSIFVALDRPSYRYQLLPLLFYSLLLGTRLSYIAFGIVLLGLWWIDTRRVKAGRKTRALRLLSLSLFAVLFQLVWITALVITEGSLDRFISLALSFTGGHFTEWGGAITEDSNSIFERLIKLLGYNLIWVGLAVESKLLMILVIAALLFAVATRTPFKHGGSQRVFLILMAVSALSYLLWALLAQNIDKPRHIAPLLLFIGFWVAVSFARGTPHPLKKVFVVLVLVLSFIEGTVLMKQQEVQIPATYQLVDYVQDQEKQYPIVVFGWEETRVMDYLQVNFPYQKVLTYELFLQRISDFGQRRILLTDHVLEGFKMQGVAVVGLVKKEKEFLSNALFEPGYHRIRLYEWKGEMGIAGLTSEGDVRLSP